MKVKYYQDEEGNIYEVTTDLEQLIIQDLYKAMIRNNEKADEIDQLKSIIKEARECVKKNMKIISKEQAKGTRLPVGSFMWNADKVLKILDKGE